ncbi:MAG: hypothetical protein GY850_11085 [bacterium]|nr:hypothetical protein [bacterium]
MIKKRLIKICVLLALFPCLAVCPVLAQAIPVALFEFRTPEGDELSYLKSGIAALIPSRMTVPGKVFVIDREVLNKSLRKKPVEYALSEQCYIARELGAAYLISGRITQQQQDKKIECFLLDVRDINASPQVLEASFGMKDMIVGIGDFARSAKKIIQKRPTVPDRVFLKNEKFRNAPPVDTSSYYVIHAGSFREESRALRQAERLTAAGFQAYTVRVDLGPKGVWHRVKVGRYRTKKDAFTVQQELEKALKIASIIIKQ